VTRSTAIRLMIAIGGLTWLAPAGADTIDFDALASGAIVTTQYPGVTFSSSAGHDVVTTAQSAAYHTTEPNFICSGVGGGITCVDPVYLDFATGVSGLHFLAVGDDSSGVIGNASVFAGATFLGSVDIVGDGVTFGSPMLIDLSAFSGITRLEITTTDPAGLGYDDFTFTPGAGAVPELVTWALMAGGFGAVGVAMRSRRKPAITFA